MIAEMKSMICTVGYSLSYHRKNWRYFTS